MKYFLRPGDFRPEEVTEQNLKAVFGQHSSFDASLKRLDAENNLFHDLDDALQASYWTRKLLISLRRHPGFFVTKLHVAYADD